MNSKISLWASYFLFFGLTISFNAWSAPTSFEQAKIESRKNVYSEQTKSEIGTLYCGCDWQWVGKSGGRVDLASCGYQVRSQQSRAERIEWEHMVPAWVFGHQRQCWQNGGRKNCVENDPFFRVIESDMHNLAPSIGEVNGDRSNFAYGMVPKNMANMYGACSSKVDFKSRLFEPRDRVKGVVARVYFYMHDRYNLAMSRQQQQLMMAWDRQYPVDGWERERDNKIARIMGHHNPFVTGSQKWELGHKNSGQGLSVQNGVQKQNSFQAVGNQAPVRNPTVKTAQSEKIKGNKNSQIYHFAHCSGYKTIADKNAVYFRTEAEAKKAGYRLAGHCKK
ncbi:DNA-specific endonuclease I (modular protein) [Xenorhabdus bovienii str. Jollieti]|uniref:DNA-specific endonuclease I (Modular protein) n=1 Tax=Xenorhabdus bovienii (strain SS-2004) TaxID=406818 RepID=D3V232_XENBS|nr:endonuclease [Xenorhabdus bovienii]CBJ81382.1 DNA-specific endonuclease I (modular protein) [Xenorhabdus bovienii SS-2004]CDH27167.1 DNA-specific endonuclease I (modular protein) [Xenorhabdus bovienii str. Jollieti]